MMKYSRHCLLFLTVVLFSVNTVFADDQPALGESETISIERQQARDRIESVLEQPEFLNKEMRTFWRLKDFELEEPEEDELDLRWLYRLLKFLIGQDDRMLGFSMFLEVLLWVSLVVVFGYLFYRYRNQISNFVKGLETRQTETELPSSMFGLELSQDSLPSDVVAEARRHWQAGDIRASIGLLFRASLSRLMHDYNCQFCPGDTEEECYQRVRRHSGRTVDQGLPAEVVPFMRQLTDIWQQLAYAHRVPNTQSFDDLCKQWRVMF